MNAKNRSPIGTLLFSTLAFFFLSLGLGGVGAVVEGAVAFSFAVGFAATTTSGVANSWSFCLAASRLFSRCFFERDFFLAAWDELSVFNEMSSSWTSFLMTIGHVVFATCCTSSDALNFLTFMDFLFFASTLTFGSMLSTTIGHVFNWLSVETVLLIGSLRKTKEFS